MSHILRLPNILRLSLVLMHPQIRKLREDIKQKLKAKDNLIATLEEKVAKYEIEMESQNTANDTWLHSTRTLCIGTMAYTLPSSRYSSTSPEPCASSDLLARAAA